MSPFLTLSFCYSTIFIIFIFYFLSSTLYCTIFSELFFFDSFFLYTISRVLYPRNHYSSILSFSQKSTLFSLSFCDLYITFFGGNQGPPTFSNFQFRFSRFHLQEKLDFGDFRSFFFGFYNFGKFSRKTRIFDQGLN